MIAVDVRMFSKGEATDACGGSWCANRGIWVNTKLSFVYLRSGIACVRESGREVYRDDGRNECGEDKETDASICCRQALYNGMLAAFISEPVRFVLLTCVMVRNCSWPSAEQPRLTSSSAFGHYRWSS